MNVPAVGQITSHVSVQGLAQRRDTTPPVTLPSGDLNLTQEAVKQINAMQELHNGGKVDVKV